MTTQNLLFFDKKGDQYNFGWNGSFWEGSILFPVVSEKLFEIEHIFVIEKFLDNVGDTKYGFPHSYGISPGVPVWRTKWESDYDGKTDVSSTIFTYELGVDTTLDAPYLVKTANVEFYPEVVSGDTISSPGGIVITTDITSSSMQINIALNSDTEGIYDRTLILEDYTDPNNPVTILKVNFHGEIEGEDSRLSVLLDNFGRSFVESDSFIVRDTDIKEPLPNYEIINNKRKELLLTGESIFPYLGSYKSLFNAIKFFGYYDLRIKEYWLNVKVDTADTLTPLQQNSQILSQLAKPNIEGQNSLELISSLLKDENEGKFKHVEIYGKRKDGTFGLKKQFEEVFPSKSYKKTALFGLFYDINRVVEDQEEDQYGYPVVEDAFLFSPEEVLLKLFGLRERLKRDYLPLNARIIDITGEGVYFNIYKTRGWVDQLGIDEVKTGIKVDFTVFPNDGYVEDLRVFYTKPNQDSLLYPAINGAEPGISYYGNTIEPYSYFQKYPVANIPLLTEAIQKFYKDVENGNIPKFLGDGDYDPPGYKLFETGEEYVFPAGCPVIIKNNTFDLSWDEISVIWSGLDRTITTDTLDVASYTSTVTSNPGTPFQSVNSSTNFVIDSTLPQTANFNIGLSNTWFSTSGTEVIFVRIESVSSPGNLILGYSISSDYNPATGNLTVQIISKRGSGTYSDWKVTPTNISTDTYEFTYFMNYVHSGGFYSWDRLPYLDFYEIEWTIYKNDDKPYYFQIRGGLPDLETLPHFLPYTGEYNVQCRVWDTLNSISLGIKRSVIKVDKRGIELNTITRYRESEKYDWENMPLKWESYPSQWIWPVENTDKTFNISDFIQNFPEYSNNFNEGQNCEVLSKVAEVKATCTFDVSDSSVSISTIQSSFVGGGYSFAVVTTTTPHGYSSGNVVWIKDIPSTGDPYGQFPITVLSSTTFEIPQIVITAISGGIVYGPGTIKVIADGVEIANSSFLGDLNSTVSAVYSSINNSPISPKYKVISLIDSVTPGSKTFVLQAPNNKGNTWNGKSLVIQTTGCLSATPSSTVFAGGSNESLEYLPYDFNTSPNPIMKYWGTKKLSWNTFEDFEFSKAYAHTWDMYDYHNDWLGGFSLYSLQYGDRVRITKDSLGVVFGETDSPGNSYLDLKEAADQLNDSTDENIKRFNYTVRGFSELPNNFYPNQNTISPDLSTNPGPKNVTAKFFSINSGAPATSVDWDGNGDVWISGIDIIKFDGQTFTTYDSSNSIIPGTGLTSNVVFIDHDDNVWVGLDGTTTPLVYLNQKNQTLSKVYDTTDFVDNLGNPILPSAIISITDIQVNSSNGDIFATFLIGGSPNISGLLYYDAAAKSWKSFTPQNSDIVTGAINRIKLEHYKLNKWYLWIATDLGLSRFDGINFINYNTGNSGLPNNAVKSIEIDKLGHKWIGMQYNLAYWDGIRWMCWNSTTNPELTGISSFLSIKDSGNSNIWFLAKGPNCLFSFDGYVFNQWSFGSDGITPINPNSVIGQNLLVAPWKVDKNGTMIYPKNLIFGTETSDELCIVDYVIPHIHATSTNPGTNGWDFVYHETSQPLPPVEYLYNSGIGASQLGFNFIIGPLNDNITLSPYTRPVMAHVDRNSWYKPIWQRYQIDYLKNQFPSLNIDDVFLYAPLRDILNGRATRESYWRNTIIERIAKKKQRDLFQNFEWIISLGNSNPEMGVKITVDNEGNNIVIGNFEGLLFMGSVNNIPSQDVYINSVTPSVFIAKYNKGGVLQWATTSTESPSVPETASSVVTDIYGNIYVVVNDAGNSYFKFLKYNPLGEIITTGTITTASYLEIFDIKIDKYESLYICGRFIGDFSLNPLTLSNNGSNKVGFIAKMDSQLAGVWGKKLGDGTYASNVTSVGLLKDEFIYCTGIFEVIADFENGIQINGLGIPDSFITKMEKDTGIAIWSKPLAENALTAFTNSTITVDPKGNLIIAGSFDGTIKIEGKTLSSFPGTTDIFVIKLTPTGKLLWMKMCGGAAGDYAYDVKSDSDEDVFVIGSFTGTAYFSPDEENSRGGKDIYLVKFNKEGLLVDIVTAGGTLEDEGLSLVLDPEENIYITGYFEGNSDFSPYIIASPPGGNNMNAFIGKIPKERFQAGLSIGSVQSWLGSHSWSWREERFYEEEFEIPLATTIFINPIDSLIPGKKNHVWTLTDTETGEDVAKIRKTPYFIWTFVNPGFYTISCSLQDANGNLYETQHKGKIRVIDHKTPFAGDLIPDVVNPEDYLVRSIYYDRKEMGFPPLNPFEVTA
jgi:hypothetical protein